MCITDDACFWTPNAEEGFDDEGLYSMTIGGALVKPRGVTSTCDGAEDCKPGQVCCYVRIGFPLGSPDNWTGPVLGQCVWTLTPAWTLARPTAYPRAS